MSLYYADGEHKSGRYGGWSAFFPPKQSEYNTNHLHFSDAPQPLSVNVLVA